MQNQSHKSYIGSSWQHLIVYSKIPVLGSVAKYTFICILKEKDVHNIVRDRKENRYLLISQVVALWLGGILHDIIRKLLTRQNNHTSQLKSRPISLIQKKWQRHKGNPQNAARSKVQLLACVTPQQGEDCQTWKSKMYMQLSTNWTNRIQLKYKLWRKMWQNCWERSTHDYSMRYSCLPHIT